MKIVKASNYDDENYNEEFFSLCGQDQFPSYHAVPLARILNDVIDRYGPDYFKVVEDDYKLRVREV